MRQQPAKFLVALLAVGLLSYFSVQQWRTFRREKVALEAQQQILDFIVEKNQVMETEKSQPAARSPNSSPVRAGGLVIPQSVNYDVPFQPQAPFAIWDEIHKDTCEEAAVVMAAFYRQGKSLSGQAMEDELLKLVDWQTERFGYWKDTTAAETATMAKEYYGLKAEVVYDFTIEQVKQELSKGKLVLVPAAGRKLGNPFFQTPGPVYHMLVLRGYDDKFIYTNDPGTKRGQNYKYYPEIILNAAADWPGSDDDILTGNLRRVMIVID